MGIDDIDDLVERGVNRWECSWDLPVLPRRGDWSFLLSGWSRDDPWLHELHAMLASAVDDLAGESAAVTPWQPPKAPVPWTSKVASALRKISGQRRAYCMAPPETVISIMTSGGALLAVRSVVVQWLKQRKGPVEITIEYPDGRKVSIKGDSMSDAAREEAVRAALRLADDRGSDRPDRADARQRGRGRWWGGG